MCAFPKYAENLTANDSPGEVQLMLMGAGDYRPYAFTSPKKSEDIPDLVGVNECGDCVGIVAWEANTHASFVYHMKGFDIRQLTYAIGLFIQAILVSSGEDSKVIDRIKAEMKALANKSSDYNPEVQALLSHIRKLDLLSQASFTLVSNEMKNMDELPVFLINRVGLESERLSIDAPQNLPDGEGAQVVLNRRNGEICKNFSCEDSMGKMHTLKEHHPLKNQSNI